MIRAAMLVMLLVAGCAPDITDTDFFREHPIETDPEDTSVELGVLEDGPLAIRLTASDSLRIGINTISAEVKVGQAPVLQADVTLSPQWIAAGRTIVSPLDAGELEITDTPGRFVGAPLFVQPQDEKGVWQLQITYAASGESGEAVLPVQIKPSLWVQYTGEYYVSWILPVRPETGLDEIELGLHRLTDEGFIPLEDATLDLYPWMDMGAGQGHSTPYEAPVHMREGRYRGSVNFIMSGGWDMTVFIQRPGMPLDTIDFKGFVVY